MQIAHGHDEAVAEEFADFEVKGRKKRIDIHAAGEEYYRQAPAQTHQHDAEDAAVSQIVVPRRPEIQREKGRAEKLNEPKQGRPPEMGLEGSEKALENLALPVSHLVHTEIVEGGGCRAAGDNWQADDGPQYAHKGGISELCHKVPEFVFGIK